MGYKVKGSAGPHLQHVRLEYDPQDGTYTQEATYSGSKAAIEGQSVQFKQKNRKHAAFIEDNGRGQLVQSTPLSSGEALEASVRYEIHSEFLEQDLFRHNTVSDAADVFDAAAAADGDTFRKTAEEAVNQMVSFTPGSVIARVVTHLRKGVTGFERESIVLRRTRKAPFFGGNQVPTVAILDGRFIYTTEQLGLPDTIAFSLPALGDLPTSDWDDVAWGWRRRPSSIVYEGAYVEQSSEFVLAEWSLLLYEPANGPAAW